MKDIYEFLNDVEIDVNEIKEISANDLEKKKLMKKLREDIKKTQHIKPKRTLTAITAASFSCLMLIGLSFTTYADELPFLGNIFKFINKEGIYDNYKENSDELNLIQKSNGIKMTVNEAIYDGNTVTITFTIESEEDLGENPEIHQIPLIKDEPGGGSHSKISKSEDNIYRGMTDFHALSEYDEAHVQWNIDRIIPDLKNSNKIKGNWAFDFHLKATEQNDFVVNQGSEQSGIKTIINKVTINPMNFLIKYSNYFPKEVVSIWDITDIDIEVKDNLGNEYTLISGQGGSNSLLEMHHNYTFSKLHPEATHLIITPKVTLADFDGYDTKYGKDGLGGKAPGYRLVNSNAPIKEFNLDKIIVPIEQ